MVRQCGSHGYVLELYSDGRFEVEVSDPKTGETLALVVTRRDELTISDLEDRD
jgi:hypothetical protein